MIFTGEEKFRGVYGVGPTLRLPLSTRWDPQLGALASSLSSTPYRDKVFEDGVSNTLVHHVACGCGTAVRGAVSASRYGSERRRYLVGDASFPRVTPRGSAPALRPGTRE